MKKRASARFWTTLTIFSLMGQVAWVVENMYFNVFIYKMFHATAGQISAMVALSAVSATITTVFMGALSDRLGKRKLFISAGYMLWGLSIFSFVFLKESSLSRLFPAANAAVLGVHLAIALDCIMTFFGSTANDAAFNAWLTDSTTKENRGAAEGINSMMPLVSILVVFGGFMFFDLDQPESWSTIFIVIGALVFLVGLLGLVLIREPRLFAVKDGFLSSILYGFSPKTVASNPALYKNLGAFILFNIAIQIFMPYLILYYEVSLGMENYVLIMAPAILIAAGFTALWGRVYDKKGFRFAGSIAMGLLIAGFLLLFFMTQSVPVFIGSLLMMCGYLAGMAVFGASIREHTPAGMAGRFQGIRIFSQVLIPGVIGPFIGKTILEGAKTLTNSDGTTSFIPNSNIFLGALVFAILVLPFFFLTKKEREVVRLKTPFEQNLSSVPFSEYPRPQMKRDSYFCLNGSWRFSLENKKGRVTLGSILVPFPPESRLSRIERQIKKGDTMIYRRSFSLPDGFQKDRVLLHFGAVDQRTEVFFNGNKAGEHEGGYLPFSFDVTEYLKKGVNEITVKVQDPMDRSLPYGKQTEAPGGMWYTKVSGIWQTVWMESVPKNAIASLRVTPSRDRVTIEVEGGTEEKRLILQEENSAREIPFTGKSCTLSFSQPKNWTPEIPYLYRFTLLSGEDRVESYFALRDITVRESGGRSVLCLNGKPYYFHGLLDQGYFPDGIFLPASPEGFRQDILKMKACGFNMLRKHIKVEPALFYYECDRLGMAVFQDMVNAGEYSFLRDTALPTLGIRSGITHSVPEKTKKAFLDTALGTLEALYHFPSVLYYTIFNEGWGQFDADRCYQICKEKDPSRIYDATSGWFTQKESDVVSEHIYFKKIKLFAKKGRPLILSEFGGYSLKIPGHCFNEKNTYGYRFFTDKKAFQKALFDLYEKEVLPCIENEGLCATVLTQVSDVEDETNGLLTYDRVILKVDEAPMRRLAKRLQEAFSIRMGNNS